ncbi:MAG: class I SAM-dependent methyltransferase [Gemmatimonadaceae bacterium]
MKHYDKSYFHRWYRNPKTRVITPGDTKRKAHLAVSAAEYMLGRPVRTVLDVGAGEGTWLPALRAIRPSVRYTGVDPSEYVVRRFGRRRNIHWGTFGALDAPGLLSGTYDLIICCGVVNYLSGRELERGLEVIAAVLAGVAFIEVWTTADDVVGDRRGWQEHTGAYYRRIFRQAGLVACGMHCYVGPTLAEEAAELERTW